MRMPKSRNDCSARLPALLPDERIAEIYYHLNRHGPQSSWTNPVYRMLWDLLDERERILDRVTEE